MRIPFLARTVFFAVIFFTAACSVVAESPIETYEQCVAPGNKVLRTFPARCVTAGGKIFVEENQPLNALPLPLPTSDSICKDLCGNGQCEQIVCMGSGCPCAENHENCPKDCAL